MFEEEWDEFDEFDEFEGEEFGEMDSELDDDAEEELALELLEVDTEEELEEFLGSLLKRAAHAAGGFLKSSVGKKLVSSAKRLAKSALPTLGGAVGNYIGGSTGRRIGSGLGRFAASQFEVGDAELATAKRVVRATCSAAKHAARTQNQAHPAVVAKRAIQKAVAHHKPMAVARAAASSRITGSRKGSGRWYRRGRRIVISGV
jgi:hypothetical protein